MTLWELLTLSLWTVRQIRPTGIKVMTSGGPEVTETGRPISPTYRHGLSKEN